MFKYFLTFVSSLFFLSILNSSAVIEVPKRRYVLTRVSPFPYFYQFFVTVPAGSLSSSTSSLPSEHLLCHSNTWALDKVFSPHASHNKLKGLVAVFVSTTGNLVLIRCSILTIHDHSKSEKRLQKWLLDTTSKQTQTAGKKSVSWSFYNWESVSQSVSQSVCLSVCLSALASNPLRDSWPNFGCSKDSCGFVYHETSSVCREGVCHSPCLCQAICTYAHFDLIVFNIFQTSFRILYTGRLVTHQAYQSRLCTATGRRFHGNIYIYIYIDFRRVLGIFL
jgi:hypothetical protein